MKGQAPSNTRLLIVEDDPALHAFIARIAQREGYEVESAYTGEHALAVLRASNGKIDGLLTDIRLPGLIDGWVVGREFSLTHALRPVIYMSGVDRGRCPTPAGSLFLRKPVGVYDLISSFRQMHHAAALAGRLGPDRASKNGPLSTRSS
jgi:two-component system OmpR family response regulator